MSQLQVRDEAGQPLARINIRIAPGIAPSDAAIYDVTTDPSGNTGWPIPFWPVRRYTLYVNVDPLWADTRYGTAAVLVDHDRDVLITLSRLSRRPAAKRQLPLPPFDRNDGGGDVAIVLPPEQQLPTASTREFWIGDAWGVTLDETPPFVEGANTTPREMVMSYLLPLYDRVWQDKILTGHAERGFSHFHLDQPTWEKAGKSVAEMVDLFKYIQSWGFFTSWWATGSKSPRNQNWQGLRGIIEPFLRALIAAGESEKSICLVGEELNSWNRPGPDGLDDIIANVCAICNPVDLPVWLHFTSNIPSWQPDGMTPEAWWRSWAGRIKGCCWQSTPSDPAGTMAARMWDTRKYLGAADSSLLVSAWELRGEEQLYGRCTEAQGALTAWELLCAPNKATTHYPAVAGSMNGPRFPDGRPFLL